MTKSTEKHPSNRVGTAVHKLLRTAQHLTLSSTLSDLREEWGNLDPDAQRSLERWLLLTPVFLIVSALLLLLAMVSNLGGTTIHVVAETEYLQYTPLVSDPPQWQIYNAKLKYIEDGNDIPDDAIFTGESIEQSEKWIENFNGQFQPHCGDSITLSRVGTGHLSIWVESHQHPLVSSSSALSEFDQIPQTVTDFELEIPPDTFNKNESAVVWPMEGRINPSRQIKTQSAREYGLLLSGNVEVVAGQIFSNSKYPVDNHVLEPGDHLILPTSKELDQQVQEIADRFAAAAAATDNADQNQKESDRRKIRELCRTFEASGSDGQLDKGFVLVGAKTRPGEPRALHVSLSSNARHVDIKRYRTSNIQVRSSWFKRLRNDPIITFGWAVVGFVLVFYRKIIRMKIIDAGEVSKLGKNQDGI